MPQDKTNPISRRAFFGVAATGAASATVLASGGARPAFAQQTGDERTKSRYQVTEQVEAFYRTNRYFARGEN